MKAIILIDNTTRNELSAEWGLAIYIEHEGKKVLLDSGKSGEFLNNAKALGIDISEVDFAVLSHAHYDHADGMSDFFEANSKANFYLQKTACENCYHKLPISARYIGIKKGTLEKYSDRIVYVDNDKELAKGIYLVAHKTPNLESIGKKAKMYVRKGFFYRPDNFSHEQSLVIDTKEGLVIFSSCSHAGADNIISEVKVTYPGKKIYAIVGGFHLFRSSDSEIHSFVTRVKETGIERIITGHCTGEKAMEILKEEFGCKVEALYSGMEIDF